jgi:hypothetical protein
MGSVRFLALGSVVLLLAACGGGGGGGGGQPQSNGNFTISTTAVTIEGDPNLPTPTAPIVTGSITGVDQTVFLTVVVTSNGLANASIALTGPTTGALQIIPKSPSALGYGTFNDTVTVNACLDSGCSRHISGSPKTINVTYNVRGVTASQGRVTFRAVEGTVPAAQQITFSNNTTTNWTAALGYASGDAVTGWLTMTPNGAATQGAQQLTFNAAAVNKPGIYSATIVTSAGNHQFNIQAIYEVTPNLMLSDSDVPLFAVTGQTAPPVGESVNVTAARGATAYTTSVSYGQGASNWLAVAGATAPGQLTLVPQTVALAPGSYGATVTLTPTGNGTPVSLDVQYNLAPSELTLTPNNPGFTINAASTAAAQFTQRSITTGDTGAPLTWTATEGVPWLTVTPAGNSGQNAILTLIPAALETVRNGAYQAIVRFTYNGPSVANAVVELPVDLSLSLPTIEYAMPHVAYTNDAQELVLRGSGFAQPGGAAVKFENVDAASVQVVSDTTLRVTPAAATVAGASRPLLSIANNLNLDRSDVDLVVRAKPNYGTHQYAFNVGQPSAPRMLYDAERDVLFVMRTGTVQPPASTSDTVLRFALDPAGVNAPVFTTHQYFFISDIGLSPDGKTLYVLTNTQLHFLDPALMTELRPPVDVPSISGLAGRMAVTNNNDILFPHMQQLYTPRTGGFRSIAGISDTATAVSADGSRVGLQRLNSGLVSFGAYDVDQNQFTFQGQERFASPLSVDRLGTRIAHGGEIFRADSLLTLYGSTGSNDGYFSLLSPNGNRLYAITFSPPPTRVHVWDTSASVTPFPELAPIDVPFGVNAMGLSLNGQHLFILDEDTLFIIEP